MEGLLAFEAEETILHAHFGPLVALLEWAGALIDLAAIAILLWGGARFILSVIRSEFGPDRVAGLNRARVALGRYILAGLELFIVSDVVHTALSLAISDLIFLLLLVVIRSIISWFLDKELEQLKRDLS